MVFPSRDRKRVGFILAALGLIGWSGSACGLSRVSRIIIPPAPAQCVWEGVERVVAVGDVHGDYEAFVTILQDQKLVGQGDDPPWTGGKAHLVQIGDVVDRMPEPANPNKRIRGPRDIYILLSRLEQEAAAAGGMVHFLPGNHEEMNLAGVSMDYVGYVTIEQFKTFVHGAYRDMHQRAIESKNLDPDEYWKTLMATDGAKEQYYRGFRDAVGGWIIGHNVIIKINGVVFVHGGISPENSRRSLEFINAKYREEFIEAMSDNQRSYQFVFDPDSPLWYRKLEGGNDGLTEADVKQILSNLKAKRIVVGHTPNSPDGPRRFGGLVWMIDSGISSAYLKLGGVSELTCLEIDINGEATPHKEERRGEKKNPGSGMLSLWHPGSLRFELRPLSAPGHA